MRGFFFNYYFLWHGFLLCLNRFESCGQSVLIKKTFISVVDSDTNWIVMDLFS